MSSLLSRFISGLMGYYLSNVQTGVSYKDYFTRQYLVYKDYLNFTDLTLAGAIILVGLLLAHNTSVRKQLQSIVSCCVGGYYIGRGSYFIGFCLLALSVPIEVYMRLAMISIILKYYETDQPDSDILTLTGRSFSNALKARMETTSPSPFTPKRSRRSSQGHDHHPHSQEPLFGWNTPTSYRPPSLFEVPNQVKSKQSEGPILIDEELNQ